MFYHLQFQVLENIDANIVMFTWPFIQHSDFFAHCNVPLSSSNILLDFV
jgi:hypothetical protein